MTVSLWMMWVGVSMASEGYWSPGQIQELGPMLEETGITIPADQLGDLQTGPLAAVVQLEGCTGAFVSDAGLVATAYHCVADALQHASAPGENLFETGYHARNPGEERYAGPNASARITVDIRDVTQPVRSGTNRLIGAALAWKMQDNSRSLVARCEGKPGVRCVVKAVDQGNRFELITQLEFDDLRLVYAPPRGVGYFGGDQDNWQWPRHSGDFAFLRVYGSSNGPSEYSPENEPYHPPTHLTTASGLAEGDAIMVLGYPAESNRWLAAAELQYAQEDRYPSSLNFNRELLDILEANSKIDADLSAKLAPRMLGINNVVQYLQGNLHAFERMGAAERKWAIERDLTEWIAADESRLERYAGTVETTHRLVAEQAALLQRDRLVDHLIDESHILDTAVTLYRLAVEAGKPDARRSQGYQERDMDELSRRMQTEDPGYDWRVDRDVLRAFLLHTQELPKGLRITELDRWFAGLPEADTVEAALDKRLVHLYAGGSWLSDPLLRTGYLGKSVRQLDEANVLFFGLAEALVPYLERREVRDRRRTAEWDAIRPTYIAAVQEFSTSLQDDGPAYSDANGSLRLGFGQVRGYEPEDGLVASHTTLVSGMSAKIGDAPYDVPSAAAEQIHRGGEGPYFNEAIGGVPVNFLSTIDATLGHSGAPTLNASGEWVGVLFDGTQESMATDWIFDVEFMRTIHTDSAFIFWYLDEVADADELLIELGQTPDVGPVAAP